MPLPILLFLFFLSVTSPASEQIETMPVESPGWLGGDAAYSRLLANNSRIWLFGDSMIGALQEGKRNAKLIRNSVAVERAGKFHYYWGTGKAGIFINKRKREWYWPGDLFSYNNKLFVFLKRFKRTSSDSPFNFQFLGTDLAVIPNLMESPNRWKIKISPIASEEISLGVAVAVAPPYLFVLGDDQKETHGLILSRMKLTDLDSVPARWEYYGATRKNWSANVTDEPIIRSASSEASLVFVPGQSIWRMVLTPNGLSAKVVVYESQNLLTWKEPKQIFSCPEMQDHPDFFCYAAKEIDTQGQELEFTYSVNSTKFQDIRDKPEIYVPRIVKK